MFVEANASKDEKTFCNGSLWNHTLSWELEVPDLTQCFQTTILPLIPLIALWLFSVYDISIYVSHRKKNIKKIGFNWYNISKLATIMSLCVVDAAKLCYISILDIRSEVKVIYPSNYLNELTFLTCHITSLVLMFMSLRYGLRRSFSQFLFYFLSVLCDAIVLRSSLLHSPISHRMIIFVVVHLILNVIMFILTSMIDYEVGSLDKGNVKDKNLSPLLSANIPSKLTFAWVTPLIWKGLKEPLQPSMLWNLHPTIVSKEATSRFEKFYKQSVVNEWGILLSLIRAFGIDFALASIIQVFVVVVSVISPQIQKQIIAFVRQKYILRDPQAHYWKGILFAFLIFATAMFLNICNGQYNHRMYVIALKIRAALSNSIYKKALKLSSTSRSERSIGEIVNLTELDVGMITVRVFNSRII